MDTFMELRIYGEEAQVTAASETIQALEKRLSVTDPNSEIGRQQKSAIDASLNQKVATIRNVGPKIGPNDPCPCGSGKKYKKCCGKKR